MRKTIKKVRGELLRRLWRINFFKIKLKLVMFCPQNVSIKNKMIQILKQYINYGNENII